MNTQLIKTSCCNFHGIETDFYWIWKNYGIDRYNPDQINFNFFAYLTPQLAIDDTRRDESVGQISISIDNLPDPHPINPNEYNPHIRSYVEGLSDGQFFGAQIINVDENGIPV